jgi:uncharacterized protein YcnI
MAERYTVRVPTERDVATISVEVEVPPAVTVTRVLAPAGFTYETRREGNRITGVPRQSREAAQARGRGARDRAPWRQISSPAPNAHATGRLM